MANGVRLGGAGTGAGAPGTQSGETDCAVALCVATEASPVVSTDKQESTHKTRERRLITFTTPSSGQVH
ncbi:hypothetical protein GCM10022419_013620 [Nonomuraea rosea]|uniref:DUF397 domain-containing protein n=1 Tax=Nonomuraea rosea TaxID=638574 RepID=A0ABP6VI45_9ACTN